MEKVKVIKEFNDIETEELYTVDKVIEMSEERISKQIMLGLVKRIEKESKTPKDKTEEPK